jgi:hypothetical protein
MAYHRVFPARIKDFVAPAGFVDDEELQQKIMMDKMTRNYVSVLLPSAILLCLAVLL